MTSFVKLPMTSKSKKVIAIAGVITIALAVIVVMYFLIVRIINKEKYLLEVNAENDRVFWKGKTELNPSVSKALISYWKTTGLNFSEAQMQSASIQNTYPWSAAYISSLVLRSGFKNFTARTTHASYTIDAKINRELKKPHSYWAFKPIEMKKIEIGDILIVNRGGNVSFESLNRSTKTHGDIVVGFVKQHGTTYCKIQGGNVSNTVMMRKIEVKPDHTFIDSDKFIAHLKYIKNEK